ncbi:MFS transporter [Larsenimonas rhizosphaerae]|uniref:MFS transporter n=1 Tax=Larsenimonas rhizosphaerae TaxID=2944682 RepID=A0AA41ZHP7_9GAMM|nr:MFS transporter [Larsenimonas rhizosphaerae]MCX2524058.1 MFS transporter [Larsenimonas rhizosphaerae]
MTSTTADCTASPDSASAAWGAVWAMALGVFSLVTAEFLPASLLTPMGQGLGVSEGQAGQAVTVTALMALVGGLTIVPLARTLDRRHVLLGLCCLLIASNLLVAVAPSLPLMLLARIFLGLALGGFWAIAAATTMRLVPTAEIPKALSIIFSGVPLATITAAALGSYLGDLFGWRMVFFMAAGLGGLTLIAQLITLPRMAPNHAAGAGTMLKVLKRPGVGIGMLAVAMVFTAHFAGFTYLRAFLENNAGFHITGISTLLLAFGVANLIATLVGGRLLEHHMPRMLCGTALFMGLALACLALLGTQSSWMASAMVIVWGLGFGATPVSWSTWITRIVPDEAESAGALFGAAIQTAIALGAAAGGVLVDATGAPGMMLTSGIVLLITLALIGSRVKLTA